jgi:hypothetical protein
MGYQQAKQLPLHKKQPQGTAPTAAYDILDQLHVLSGRRRSAHVCLVIVVGFYSSDHGACLAAAGSHQGALADEGDVVKAREGHFAACAADSVVGET